MNLEEAEREVLLEHIRGLHEALGALVARAGGRVVLTRAELEGLGSHEVRIAEVAAEGRPGIDGLELSLWYRSPRHRGGES